MADLGSIRYTMEVDTSEQVAAEKNVLASNQRIETSYKKLDKSIAKSSSSFANLSRNSGQAGIQIQQFVGQIQGGQSAMLALSQQAADLGIVLGAPLVGAVVGISASLAGILLPSLFETEDALGKFKEKQKEIIEGFVKFNEATDKASKNDAILTQINRLNIEYNNLTASTNRAKKEQEEIARQMGTARESEVGFLQARYESLTEVITENSKKQVQLGKDMEEVYASGLPQFNDQVSEAEMQLMAMTKALQMQVETLGMSERGLALYTAEQLGATQADVDAINAKYDIIEAHRAEQEQLKQLNNEKERGTRFAEGVISKSMTDEQRFASDLVKLEELRAQGLIAQELYDQAIVASVESRARQIDKINAKQEASEYARLNTMLMASSNFFSAMAGIIQTGGDEQSDAYKAMFALSKGFAAAQAALNLSTAISQASTLPWPANIPAMASAFAAGTQLVSAINGANYSGARQYGGPVSNGKAYLVGERGPEMFVPNGNGQIVSNGDMGGSGEITVIVNNNAPAKAYATVDEVNRIVKVEISDLSNQVQNNTGPFYRSLTQATNVRGRNG